MSELIPPPPLPVAEQTAVAADCIKECTAYLKQLAETYEAAVATNITYDDTGIECDNTQVVLDAVVTLTDSIAKLIDRLPVGAR